MRKLLVAIAAAAALVLAPSADAGRVAIFYYPWYGNPRHDATFLQWNQGGRDARSSIATTFFPARGTYSCRDPQLLNAQMAEISAAGIDQIITSWWGPGSSTDRNLVHVLVAARSHGLSVAVHLEPYAGRTAESTRADIGYLRMFGIRDFYVYDSPQVADEDWAALNGGLDAGVRLFANTPLVGKAAAGGFDGLYSYDVLIYDGSAFHRMCRQARRAGLLCAPSVGPGFDARRATPERRVQPRRDGARYDHMWRAAIAAQPHLVTITSYNEWLEGTQIEPARSHPDRPQYGSYEGAYGRSGRSAEYAYLNRTAFWAKRFRLSRAR
jgi:glycoprotein endo-alpha-1,2-mannosidase